MPGGPPALIEEAPLSESDRPISKKRQERQERRLTDQISRLPFPPKTFASSPTMLAHQTLFPLIMVKPTEATFLARFLV
jgi:hypothetical protein